MAENIYLKSVNYGPLKQGTLGLKDGFLRIPKYTVIIGDQGTGKSTIAKLFSTLSWIEKSFIRKNLDPKMFSTSNLQALLENQNLPREYITDETELEYRGQVFSVMLKAGKVRVVQVSKENFYRCPQIMYYPSERNILSVVENPWEVKGFPEMVYQLASEYLNAGRRIGKKKRKLFGSYKIEFDPVSNTSFISDSEDETRIPLSNASSGLQSVTPLLVVSDYLAKGIEENFLYKLKIESINIKQSALSVLDDSELQRKLLSFFSSGLKDCFLTPDIEQLKNTFGYLVNSCLWQIVEEPEQNLYPSSQLMMVNRLLNNTSANGKLIMTTHSPYILSVLNNYIFANDIYERDKKTIKAVSKNLLMNYEDVAAYKIKDGTVKSIMDEESRMIDVSEIDECSRVINSVFDRLMDKWRNCES